MARKKKPLKLTAENYYSPQSNWDYVSASQSKDFIGSLGRTACEAAAMARLRGEIQQEDTVALLVGAFVDSYFAGEMDKFMEEHPDCFSSRGASKGELKAPYKNALRMIERVEADELFMK